MKSRLWLCLIVGLLALSILPAAAQDDDDHEAKLAALNCLGLSDEDCAIVTASFGNLETIESFTLEFSFSTSSGNTEGMVALPGLGGAADIRGTATVAIDREAMSERDRFAGVSIALNMSGTMSDRGETTDISNNIVIVDGTIYIQNAETSEWVGTNIEELSVHPGAMEMMSGGVSVMGMPMNMGDMMGMGAGAMGDGDMGDMDDMFGDFELEELLAIPGFLSQTRLPDDETDGQPVNVFSFVADLGVLFQNESVRTAIGEAMAGSMGAGTDNPMGAQMAAMMPVVLENTTGTVTLTRWIGSVDQLPRRVLLDVQAAIDLYGDASGNNTPIPPITISMTADASLRDINSTPAPTAPEGATVLSAEEFIALSQPEATAEATP